MYNNWPIPKPFAFVTETKRLLDKNILFSRYQTDLGKIKLGVCNVFEESCSEKFEMVTYNGRLFAKTFIKS
jgi:hypothetical protein